MTNTPFSEMKRLQEALSADDVGIESELTTFPSGAAILDVRRDGRGFVMAFTPAHGFGVDELHEGDGFLTAYRFVFDDFDSAARQMRTLALAAPAPTLSLLVLQSSDVETAKDFYRLLGLSFVEEQHGKGPRHYSANLGGVVLEIYPCQANVRPAPVRIGFSVPSLDETLGNLRQRGTHIIGEAKDSPWGRRAVVEDPDGNRVELTPLQKR